MSRPIPPRRAPVAIVGIACRFPGADDVHEFWSSIRRGMDCIRDVPESHWAPADYFDADPKRRDHTYARRGGFLSPVDFDPLAFGIAPNTIEATDTSQLLALLAARDALADAGYGQEGRPLDRERVSVLLGVTGTLELVIPLGARLGHPLWRRALREAGVDDATAEDVVARIADGYVDWQEASFPGLLGNVVAGRIANRLDLGGTNCVVDAACASSLSALHLALLELESHRADVVLSGGVDTFNDIFMYMCFSKTPALSPSGSARPFSRDGDGTTLGEGVGIIVLKRLADAQRDGDRIYAVIRGLGSASDGRGNAIYAPCAAGQARALRRAYEDAGVEPESVDLVEAHGTGTAVGDATELRGLRKVFGSAGRHGRHAAVGSVKSQIGHTKAAAGIAGVIKSALALHHRVIPPTIKVTQPLPELEERDCPFYVTAEERPWIAHPNHPRRAGVSAFGFGGSNFHCVLEEAGEGSGERVVGPAFSGDEQIITLSATSVADLREELASWQSAREWPWAELRARAASTREQFDSAAPHRLTLVIERAATNIAALVRAALALLESRPDGPYWNTPEGAAYGAGPRRGELALLFPGQGAQRPGMLRRLACQFPEFHDVIEEADRQDWAQDRGTPPARLSESIYPPTPFSEEARHAQAAALAATERAQPALGAVELGAWRVLESFGVRPDAVAGHSYGELVALCVAGVFEERDLHQLSNFRGRLMAAPASGERGTMLAVSAPEDDVRRRLRDAGIELTVANLNAPRQVVLSGACAEVERAARHFQDGGTPCRALEVSAAFHSPFVADAEQPFRDVLRKVAFAAPRCSVYANSTGRPYPQEMAGAQALLAGQLARPVRFVDMVRAMHDDGARTFLEVGPGARLTGLVGAILEGRDHLAIVLDGSRGRRDSIADLARALGQLAALGESLHLRRWDAGFCAPARRERPRFTVPICGANYVPPRPPRETRRASESPPPADQGAAAEMHPAVNESVTAGEPQGRDGGANRAGATAASQVARSPRADRPAKTPTTAQEEIARSVPDPARSPALAAPPRSAPPVVPARRPAPQTARWESPPMIDRGPEPRRAPDAAAEGEAASPVTSPIDDVLRALHEHQERTARLHELFLEGQLEVQRHIAKLATRGVHVEVAGAAAAAADPEPRAREGSALAEHCPGGEPTRFETLSGIREKAAETPPEADTRSAETPALGDQVWAPEDSTEREGSAVRPRPDRFAEAAPPVGTREASGSESSGTARELLVEVVAEKTGYPVETLDLDLDLEADLGIDSIKRVEILSALQERIPSAPVVGADELGRLQTLRQVLERLRPESGAGEAPSGEEIPSASSASPTASRTAIGATGVTTSLAAPLTETLIAVVADKTGYPAEALDLDLDLEADLGIDSIKRVEILSALQERAPSAPAVGADELGRLQTLRQVLERLDPAAESGPEMATQDVIPAGEIHPASPGLASQRSPSPSAPDGVASAPTDDLRATLVAVVADKTGYPAEALDLDLDLEADLGIDSIKRVEILSALQERAPSAPAVSADELGRLQTLRQVLEHLAPPAESRALPAASPDRRPERAPEPRPANGAPAGVESATALPSRVEEVNRAGPARAGGIDGSEGDGLARWVVVPERAPAPEAELRLASGASIWVRVGDDRELGEAVRAGLRERGLTPVAATASRIAELPAPSGLVILPTADHGGVHEAFRLLRGAGPALVGGPGDAFFCVATARGGRFALTGAPAPHPAHGALAGLAKTARWEWPDVSCRTVDLERSSDVAGDARRLIEEILRRGGPEVGLDAAGGRWVPALRAQPAPPSRRAPALGDGEVILVTGGARGVTAEATVALARRCGGAYALVGRTPLPVEEPAELTGARDGAAIMRVLLEGAPNRPSPRELDERCRSVLAAREIRVTLQRLHEAGCRAKYFTVDVTDRAAVAALVERVRQEWGPVRGWVHGAGVIADHRIEDKADDEFARVYDTKVRGAENALAQLRDELAFAILFSSSTARFGRRGQVDYAAANEALNAIAQRERRARPHTRVVAIDWGPWRGGMVTPALERVFVAEGIAPIPLVEGAELCADEACAGPDEMAEIVVLGGGSKLPAEASIAAAESHDERPPEPSVAAPVETSPPGSSRGREVQRIPLSVASHPLLRSHVIGERAVLPFALALEWLAVGTLHAHPGYELAEVCEARVLRGVRLGADDEVELRIVAGEPVEDGARLHVPVQLRSPLAAFAARRPGVAARGGAAVDASSGPTDGAHVEARIVLRTGPPLDAAAEGALAASAAPLPRPVGSAPFDAQSMYRDLLFHGPDFEGIEAVTACDESGIAGRARPAPLPAAWLARPLRAHWLLDPLVMDVAFQLLIVWCRNQRGAPCLPCAVERVERRSGIPRSDTVEVVCRVQRATEHTLVADADVASSAGEVLVRLSGIECAVDPGLETSFRARGLPSPPIRG